MMLPFHGGIEATENATLIFSAVAALFYAFMLEMKPSWPRSAVKTVSIALLAVLAFQLDGPLLLIAGLTLGAIGDFFLSRDGDKMFLAGLASFLASHVAYIVLFLGVGAGLEVLLADPWRGAAAALLAALTLVLLAVLMRRVPPTLRVPVIAYSIAIFMMGVSALTTPNGLVIAGAAAFIASDSILAWERFVSPAISSARPLMRQAVWALYYVAQAMIALGFLGAL